MRQLFIGLDGVLADFDGYYEECFGVRPDRATVDPPNFWDNISAHGSFYASLKRTGDALTLWRGAKLLHPQPIILTGIPYSVPNVEQHKRQWVAEFIDPKAPVICCASKDKKIHGRPGDILVDDWDRYRPLWEEMGGTFVLHRNALDSLAAVEVVLSQI